MFQRFSTTFNVLYTIRSAVKKANTNEHESDRPNESDQAITSSEQTQIGPKNTASAQADTTAAGQTNWVSKRMRLGPNKYYLLRTMPIPAKRNRLIGLEPNRLIANKPNSARTIPIQVRSDLIGFVRAEPDLFVSNWICLDPMGAIVFVQAQACSFGPILMRSSRLLFVRTEQGLYGTGIRSNLIRLLLAQSDSFGGFDLYSFEHNWVHPCFLFIHIQY